MRLISGTRTSRWDAGTRAHLNAAHRASVAAHPGAAFVAATASAIAPNTGTGSSSKRTEVPAFPGVTPPTMRVPDMIMRCVCLRPSLPVMPWTSTREEA